MFEVKASNESLVKDVFEVIVSMTVVHAKLAEAGLIGGMHNKCKVCLSTPNQCEEFREYLQRLMDQHVVQFSRMMITFM